MGAVAPIIGVVSAIGGAISSSNAAAAQNNANALQIEANRREESIRLMDVEQQRQSNVMDFEVASQQRVAALAASLSNAEVQRLDNRTQRAIQAAQIGSARSAVDVGAAKGEVSREAQQQNVLQQAAQANGIDIQGIPYEQLASNVVTQRAAIMAALNPMMADMYRTREESAVLDRYDQLRNAEGLQQVQLDYSKQYGDLLEQYADVQRGAADTTAAYQEAAARNSLNASDAMQQSAFSNNNALFGTAQEMQSVASKIGQLSDYRKLVGNENLANSQERNIRSATSARNAEVSRTNKSYSIFDSLAPIASAGISLFGALQQQQQQPMQQNPVTPTPALRISDSRYDPNYRYNTEFYG